METINKQTIILDIRRNSTVPLPQFIQYDTNILEFNIKDKGANADLADIQRINLNYKRPDGQVTSHLLTWTGNIVKFEFTSEEMAIPGYGDLELQFFDETSRISTIRLKVNILDSIGPFFEGSKGLPLLQELFVEVAEAIDLINDTNVTFNEHEASRQTQEALRQTAEGQRDTAEIERKNAESTRISNEDTRKTNETGRVNAETARANTENTRAQSETNRQNAETDRANAEQIRQQNETNRQNNTAEAITNAENATTAATEQAAFAQQQGDYAKEVGDQTKTRWLPKSATFADIATTYPTPAHGDTVQVTDTANVYRFETGNGWVNTHEYNANVIDNLNQQLADTKKKELVSVTDFGAKGDGVKDDTDDIQENATLCDTELVPYMYFPTYKENYLITAPIRFNEPGIEIFGFKAPSYNRGLGKNGNILIGGSAPYALDLGNSRVGPTGVGTSNNPADTWTVSGLGFKRAPGVPSLTKKGIAITSQQNGPDRGILFEKVSMSGLEAGIYIPPNNPNVSIQAANINIERSVLSNNKYAVWNEGKVYGFRMVKCEAEQNTEHAVKGSFNGQVTISDNMLEGQKNAICVTDSVAEVKFESKGNYFESNHLDGSEYIYMIGNKYYYNRCSAKIGPNFTSGVDNPPDIVRLTGAGKWLFELYDHCPLTLYQCSASLIKGSKIFNGSIDHYRIRSLSTSPTTLIYVNDGLAMLDVDNTHIHVKFTSADGVEKLTPFGLKYVRSAFDSIAIPVGAVSGDLVVLNFLIRTKKNNYAGSGKTITINNVTNVYVDNGDPSAILECSSGEWVVVSMPWICPGNVSEGFKVAFTKSADEVIEVAGVAVKNYGQFANDGTTVVKVSPVCPII